MKKYSKCEVLSLAARVWTFDIFWSLARKGIEITTVVYFWYADYYLWGILTTIAILLPGILEVLYWSVTTVYNCRQKGCCYWSFLFNPIFYPFTMMAWNLSVITSGIDVYEEKYPTTRALTMIQTVSESVTMMMVQIYILLQTWRFNEMNILQGLSSLMSMLTVCKEFGEQHFHELSGKTDIPSSGQVFAGFTFYFVNIMLRLSSFVILSIFLHHWFIVFVIIFAFINFLAAFKLKTDVSKNIWTSFGAIVAPICFVSKLKIAHYKHAGDTFHKFYLWNSLAFFILTLFSHIALNFFLVYGNDLVGQWLLDNIRLVHFLGEGCFSAGQTCSRVHIASTVAVVGALLQPVFVWVQPNLFQVMIGEHFPKTSSIIDL